ncbi:hypothetical protein B0H13DRAFT_2321686 [Mycena leptocephala]|nr:hypothetical protein B0H13DRAFT_2321686 [Mycena leptocephala]
MRSSFTVCATISLLLAFCASLSTSAPAQSMTATPPAPMTCGDPSNAVPLYVTEQIGVDYLYTIDNDDLTADIKVHPYVFRGTAARVFATRELSTVPFFRLFNPTLVEDLYTISVTERVLALESGYKDGGIISFIYPSQICGSIPFYRMYSSATAAHFYTINETDRDARLASGGWADEGIAGYVLDLNPRA